MCLHLTRVAGFEPAIHISQNPAFHPFTAHNNLPSIQVSAHRSPTDYRPTFLFASLLLCFLTSLLRLFSTSSRPPPMAPAPLANSHTPGTTTTSTHSPNIPESSRSRCNPVLDTCAAAPPLAASPAIFRSRAGSSSSGLPRPDVARCSDACPRHPTSSRRRPQHRW